MLSHKTQKAIRKLHSNNILRNILRNKMRLKRKSSKLIDIKNKHWKYINIKRINRMDRMKNLINFCKFNKEK
jgi:hypothetical protein